MKPPVLAVGSLGVRLLGWFALLRALVPATAAEYADPRAPLATRFANPPATHRILKIIHPWPDEPARQEALRDRLQKQGFGGVVCNVAFDAYLESEAHWKAFDRAVRDARQAGFAMWLYDEKGYPSGSAGGLVLRDHPDWEAEGLLVADTECGAGPLKLELPPGEAVTAVAFPLDDTARSQCRSAGRERPGWLELPRPAGRALDWQAPPGRWQVAAFTRSRLYEGTHAEGNLSQKMPYVNLLRPEPTQRFLELTHAAYARQLGSDLGAWFDATFTDEPSLMSLFLQRMPWRPLPWSPELPAEFRRRRGYDLAPVLPDLVSTAPGPGALQHRHDYWLTIGELVSENYFGQIQTWCRRHGLAAGGHLLAEERLLEHVPLYGDFFRCLRRLDAPSMDCLTSVPADVPWHVARLVASAAELDGHPLVMCETSDHSQVWRPPGDQRPKRVVTEAEIRGTCNRLLLAGVNAITSYYSFEGLPDEALQRLNRWVGRAATQLRGGHAVADVAVVYPAESLAAHFLPARHWAGASPDANRIEHLYRSTLDTLFEGRRDVTIVDSRTLVEAEVRNDTLVHGPFRWRVVILPGIDTLPSAAWRQLERFVEGGGLVVALGATPANSESEFPGEPVLRLAARLFGTTHEEALVRSVDRGTTAFLPAGTESLLAPLLDQALPASVGVGPGPGAGSSPVRATHRRVEGLEVYFVINDGAAPWSGTVTLPSSGPGSRWDLATGEAHPVPAAGPWPLALEPYGATLLTFASAQVPAREPLRPGPVPAPALAPIAHAAPLESHGEFVRATLAADDAHTAAGRPAWRAAANLTRTKVDTFLFVRLPVKSGSELANAELLELETWVPEGQRTAAGLLVILAEEGGGDYLVELARPLDASGYQRTFVPLNRFRLAGWSTDANGRLDQDRIREIRVGWGGYYGVEGEPVAFSLRAPRFSPRVAPVAATP